ncbi:cytochrome P450 [Streptomyces sp. NBC_01590]|uniref:cytochrome P450 family protein n=1 Tax=Streptomyces sp. NBC_01590 TaxID=2975887 RepID=UPI003864BFBE
MTAPQRTTQHVPVLRLDPTGADHQGEAARLRELGPVVKVILPGDVEAWAVTTHQLLTELVNDPRVSKDWHRWTDIRTNRIPEDWPLTGMVKVTNMVTADGDDHRRLRRVVTQVLTPERVRAMRPRITELARALVQALPERTGPDGSVDLREHLAYPLPMTVICDVIGVPGPLRPQIRRLVRSIFDSTAEPEEVLSTQHLIYELLDKVVAHKRRTPGDDLTSNLIVVQRDNPDHLSDTELTGTLWLMIAAGHETTLSLITNAQRALLTHPDQLDLALSGGPSVWPVVVEETLRWDAPIGNFLARYPREDLRIGGVTIPAGDAVLAPYSTAGRDTAQHGQDAHRFDITRDQARHLAFGGGPHVCLGAPLARMEAAIALEALFSEYPGLSLATNPESLVPVPSLISNSVQALPAYLNHHRPNTTATDTCPQGARQ